MCSSRERFNEECGKLLDIFMKNGYSKGFFDKLKNSFLKKKEAPPPETDENIEEEEVKCYVLRIPFVGKPSLLFRSKISNLFKDKLNTDLRCVFTSCKVKDYFSLKCKSPVYLLSNVTYKYRCQGDPGKVYIGETKQHILTRAAEHGVTFTEKYPTAIGKHIQECDHCQEALTATRLDFKSFEILNKCKSPLECQVREAFLIQKEKPSMNVQLYQSGASLTLKIFG